MFIFSFKFHVQAWSWALVSAPVIDRLIKTPKGGILKLRTNTATELKLFTIIPHGVSQHHFYWHSGSDHSLLREGTGGGCPIFCTRCSRLHSLYSRNTSSTPTSPQFWHLKMSASIAKCLGAKSPLLRTTALGTYQSHSYLCLYGRSSGIEIKL